MGGSMETESIPDRGCRFTLVAPVASVSGPAAGDGPARTLLNVHMDGTS